MKTIEAGYTYRWFCIDWDFFRGAKATTDLHDEIMNALGDMKNSAKVNSGHTGFNVCFEDDKRSDEAIIKCIQRTLKKFKAG